MSKSLEAILNKPFRNAKPGQVKKPKKPIKSRTPEKQPLVAKPECFNCGEPTSNLACKDCGARVCTDCASGVVLTQGKEHHPNDHLAEPPKGW